MPTQNKTHPEHLPSYFFFFLKFNAINEAYMYLCLKCFLKILKESCMVFFVYVYKIDTVAHHMK